MDFDDYESLPTGKMSVHMSAGAVAGVMEHVVMYPVDSVKVSLNLKLLRIPRIRSVPIFNMNRVKVAEFNSHAFEIVP